MSKDSFQFYRSFFQTIDALPIEMQRNLYRAVALYGLNEEEMELGVVEQAVWFSFKAQLDANWRRYYNGRKGGNPNFEKGKRNPYYPIKDNQEISETLPRDNQEISETLPNRNSNTNTNRNRNRNTEADKSAMCETSSHAEIIKQFFNQVLDEHNSLLPRLKGQITNNRLILLNARINTYGIDAVKEAITKAAKSDFLNGRTDGTFRASFDWIMRPNNFPKVLDGNYDNRQASPANQTNSGAMDRSGYHQISNREYSDPNEL